MNDVLSLYVDVIKKYVEFNGRARRREFWMFFLCNFVIGIGFSILSLIPVIGGLFSVLSWIFSLAIFVPSLSVGVRRLHDTNKSGLLYLLGLIPLVGLIILIVFWATNGDSGKNQYGADPKR